MRSPFPGMDPYLQDPIFWSEFHSRLIMTLSTSLLPQLLPNYYIGIETRTYLDGEGLLIGKGRSTTRPTADLYAFTLQEPIPTSPLP